MKSTLHHMSSGKCKLEQLYITTYVLETLESKNTDITKCRQGSRVTGTLIHSWWECKMVQPLGKIILAVSHITKPTLPTQFSN